ncbi:hypothetical protein MMC30_001880 [Trapelia coarctata]|nr:hypothetical protein [Trapelia coarctata]
MAPQAVGSDGWMETFDHPENGYQSAIRCMTNTNWDNVVKMCSGLRGGVCCDVAIKFTMGSQNFVRLIQFEDGVKWVIRIPLDDKDPRWAADTANRMKNEVATYKYLKLHTSIPVPEVHGYNAETDADIGAPYMLLTYIHGTRAYDFGLDVEQSRYVQRQMIEIMLELASHKFDRIGSLVRDESGDFAIGKDMETNQGPFTTAGEYYAAFSTQYFHLFADHDFENNLDAERCSGLHLPFMFNSFMQIFTDCANDHGPFSLTNTDLGDHNIILDAECNIVGLIDCDNIIAAPIHVVAQIPSISGTDIPPPGLATRNPYATLTYEDGAIGSAWFAGEFKAAEGRRDQNTPISDAMLSDPARLFEGLCHYGHKQIDMTNEWARSYMYIYYRRLRGGAGARVFSEAHIFLDDEKDETAEGEGGNKAEETKEQGDGDGKSSSNVPEDRGVDLDECCNAEPQTADAMETAPEGSVNEIHSHKESPTVAAIGCASLESIDEGQ